MYLSTPDVFFTFRNFLWNDEDGTLKTFDIIFQRCDQMMSERKEYRGIDRTSSILFTECDVYFFPVTSDNDAIRYVAARYGELARTFYVERDVTIEDFLNSEQFLMYFRKFHMRLDYEEISRGLELKSFFSTFQKPSYATTNGFDPCRRFISLVEVPALKLDPAVDLEPLALQPITPQYSFYKDVVIAIPMACDCDKLKRTFYDPLQLYLDIHVQD